MVSFHQRPTSSAIGTALFVAAAILVGGIVAIPAIAARQGNDEPVARLQPDAPPTAEPDTDVVVTEPPLRPWLEPIDVPVPTDLTPNPDALQRAQLEQCRLDYGTMTAVALAFVTQTRSVPDEPDVVASTWLHEMPDGWNDEWRFDVAADGLLVVPTPGGACDL